MALVYIAKCVLNNMVYVGKTDRALEKRKKEHLDAARQGDNSRFHQQLLEQGFAHWKWDKLAECDDSEQFAVEKEWIRKFRVEGLELLNYTHNPKPLTRATKGSRFKKQAAAHKTWANSDAIAWMYMDGKITPVKNLNTGVKFRSLCQAEKRDKIGRASIKRSCETGYLAMNGCRYSYVDLEGNERLTEGHRQQLTTKVRRSYSGIKHLVTNKTFHTVEEAAKAFGLKANNVQAVCGNQYRTTGGHSFCYIDHDGKDVIRSKHKQFLQQQREKERYCLAVYELTDVNYEHPRLFATAIEIAKALSIANRTHIPAVIKGKRSHVEGYRVAKYDKNEKKPILTEMHKNAPRKVIREVMCLDDDQIFESCAEAARNCGGSGQQVALCCKGKLRTTGRGKQRLRFAYIDEDRNPLLTETHRKAEESLDWKGTEVYCPEFEKRFNSVAAFCREAKARGANLPGKRVRRHLKDPNVSLGGLHVFRCDGLGGSVKSSD